MSVLSVLNIIAFTANVVLYTLFPLCDLAPLPGPYQDPSYQNGSCLRPPPASPPPPRLYPCMHPVRHRLMEANMGRPLTGL